MPYKNITSKYHLFILKNQGSFPGKRKILHLLCIAIFFCVPTAQSAGPANLGSIQDKSQDSWHITADKIEFSRQDDQYVAEGDVVIIGKEQKINAEYVRYDRKNKKAYALGNVILTAGEDVLRGERMTLDLENQTGVAYQGTVFIREGHYRIWGDKIQKTGERTYIAENAVVTTCEGDRPDWKVSGTEAEVTIEGYGTVTHATLWAREVPVIYSPFLFFPAKKKRQSGFLAPRFSFSDRLGTEYEQPYFWAINDQADATFYWDHMGERGEKIGTEYRYVINSASKGTVMLDYLKDDKIDDGTEDSSVQWGYDDDAVKLQGSKVKSEILRTNSERYWFRMKDTRLMPYQFIGKLDLDVVSDQDYLTEFRDGYSGFDESAGYYEKDFGRGLDDYTDTTRTNTIIVGKSWDRYSLSVEGRWMDDLLKRQGKALVEGTTETEDFIQDISQTDNTVQRLPLIQLNGSKQEAWDRSWLYWSFDTQAAFFYRIDGVRGDRTDIYPRFYVPMRYKNYFSFEPSIGVRETLWYVTDYNGGSPDSLFDEENLETSFNREIYDLTLDLSTEVYRVYSPGWKSVERFRHAITPQVVYEYRPNWDQSEYPVFDYIDRLGGSHLITYSLVNTFTSRFQVNTPGQTEEEAMPEYAYKEFCRFELSQSYDINQRNVSDPQPFSAVTGRLNFSLWRYVSLNTDGAWNPYLNRLTRRNIGIELIDNRGDQFNIGYRLNRNSTESLNINSTLVLTEQFSLYLNLDRDLVEKKYIETRASLLYKTGCWSADFGISKNQDNIKYSIMVSLFGLGGFGRSVRPDDENNLKMNR
ncbi:MAG: LPS-assembly protein LptD [Desulfobacteraceae bacterium]|nr:MAG: LPS-assembly protein LptD [Desulfobacteraceae bacterium]